jgi:hypothetical protein
VAMLVAAVGIAEAKIAGPKSGATYVGTYASRGHLEIAVATSKSLRYIALRFPCKGTVTGATTLQDITVKKGKTGYSFSILTYGGVTYSDDQRPDNAKVNIAGAFNRTGKRVAGTVRVKTPRCGDSGSKKWSAKR